MAELASGPGSFAVEVDVDAVDGERGRQAANRIDLVTTEDVDCRDGRSPQGGRTERPVKDSAQVLLELGGGGTFDGPVP